MQSNHATLRRPHCWLALAIAIFVMALAAACGPSAQPAAVVPDATPEPEAMTASTDSRQSAAGDSDQPHANGGGAGNQDSGDSAVADVQVINLAIAGRATTLTRDDLRVSQGDTVRLAFTSDEPGEVHLHGYDLTAEVSPDHPGELVFAATTAGAFGINFHVFGGEAVPSETMTVVSQEPVSVSITAEPDAAGGVNVSIQAEGFRFAEELVDQAHTPGAGHAHIYVDGVKLGRVFGPDYHIDSLSPGEHEIRVALNTNDHSELVYDGANVESIVTVTVPDVGQGAGQSEQHGSGDGDTHDGHDHDHGEIEIVAEVHLGNLEVYP